jgi:hypothetical protein
MQLSYEIERLAVRVPVPVNGDRTQ